MSADGPTAAATSAGAVDAPRRVGRPRDARVDEAILRAAFDLLGELGIGQITVDAVAARAGVGKATIYRRWPSKGRLIVQAMSSVGEAPAVPDTGSLRGDLETVFAEFGAHLADDHSGRKMVDLAAEAAQDPDLRDLLRDFVDGRRERGRTILRRAVERGELPADVDVDLFLDLMSGPAVVRRFLTHQPVTPDLVGRTIDVIARGFGATHRPTDPDAPGDGCGSARRPA